MPRIVPTLKQWRAFFDFRKMFLLSILSMNGWAIATDAAVIYPDLPQPYSLIFEQIIEGVEDEMDGSVAKFPIGKDTDFTDMPAKLRGRRKNNRNKVAIFLGKQSLQVEESMDAAGVPLILAAVLDTKEYEQKKHPILSLAPDPTLLFKKLKSLMPSAKRVVVVYNPEKNAWLIDLAKVAAKRHGLKLTAYEARDLQSAISFYRAFFSRADNRQDALWLLQDTTTVEERAVLPLVLRESWNNNLVIFSSNLTHVKRGVLFALYPDNRNMGKSIGALAKSMLKSPKKVKNGMRSLRDVKSAINMRTLRRVGLTVPKNVAFEIEFSK